MEWSEESLIEFGNRLVKYAESHITECGKHPYRKGQRSFADNCEAINDLVVMAIVGMKCKRRNGNKARILAAEMLRTMAEQIEREES